MPTYNECDNIKPILQAVRHNLPEADILVIDDGSPDGTADLADEMGRTDSHISVLRRKEKLGLGLAYIDGFKNALAKGYEAIICMDSDFSHDPAVLPKIVDALADNDFVLGSRYIPEGGTPDWTLHRRLISRIGNITARMLLNVPIKDCTTGYRGYRREALEKLGFDKIKLTGYGFMIETAYQNYLNGMRIKEIPIIFPDRRFGKSKMSGAIVKEALFYVVKLRWQHMTGQRTAVDTRQPAKN
ncbi:MAG: polyprenol monophosphomannose synthase [Chthoniobacteraceae bacterium]